MLPHEPSSSRLVANKLRYGLDDASCTTGPPSSCATMDLGLQGVHVLVTGASGGIGLETTKRYCSLGAKVTAHYNSRRDPLLPLLEAYPTLHLVQADLTDEPTVIDLFNSFSRSDVGPVQVLVVNHAIIGANDVPVAEMSLEHWNHTIKTNITSCFLACREYLKHLKEAKDEAKDKASIVFVGSIGGKFGRAGYADYAVTKSGMMYGLTMTLKDEIVKIAPRGRVNTVAPGMVYTSRAEALMTADPALRYSALATTPLKKFAMPADVAAQIVIQSSSVVSGHVTGQVLMVEGGMEGWLLNKPEDF